MELVKKNIVSVICGVVAIVAIVASFVPLGGYVEELQGSLNKSKTDYSSLDTLRTKQRNLPILKLEETTPQPLGMFPSKDVIEKARAVTKQVEDQSIEMRKAAVAMNQRKELVPGSLPEPRPPFDIRFRDQYTDLVAPRLLNGQPTGEPPKLLQKYNAGVLPQQTVIEAERLRRRQEILETKVQKDARGTIINQLELNELNAQVDAEVPQQLRRAVAEKSMFYVEVSPQSGSGVAGVTLDVAPGIVGNARPRPEAVWWAQVMLWVQTDVLNAIKEANTTKLANGQAPKNLMEAPVKRLLRIQIPTMNIFVTAAGQAPAAADPNAAADAALPKVVQASPTGRVSNGMFDVVHFQVIADMEVEKIPQVIRTFSHNRLMSVFHVDVKHIDASAAQLAGYYYNPPDSYKPVAQVTMHCEMLLLRNWTAPLMPKVIRTLLQIPDAPAPGAAPAAPADAAAAPQTVAP